MRSKHSSTAAAAAERPSRVTFQLSCSQRVSILKPKSRTSTLHASSWYTTVLVALLPSAPAHHHPARLSRLRHGLHPPRYVTQNHFPRAKSGVKGHYINPIRFLLTPPTVHINHVASSITTLPTYSNLPFPISHYRRLLGPKSASTTFPDRFFSLTANSANSAK